MIFDYENEKLPEVFQRDNKGYYLDPIRKKLILITPEETVRQKMLYFIMNSLGIPEKLISVEEILSNYGINSKKRADIIINEMDDNGDLCPLCIVECKSPTVLLSDKDCDQLFEYCDYLCAPYAILTYGYCTFQYKKDELKNEYVRLDTIPTFEEMLNGDFIESEEDELFERTPFNLLKQMTLHYQYDGYISYMTSKEIAFSASNLLECLRDESVCIPTGFYGMFTLLKDYGIRTLRYGNHSGGVFSGEYRTFIIDFNGNTEFVSFGISTYGTALSNIEKTVLNVAIDNEETSHHALQLVLDDNLIIHDGVCDFYHHGRIANGNKGSIKISELRSVVEMVAPDLIYENKFYLGSLPIDRLWTLHDKDVIELITNIICYAIIRDSCRKYKKNLE